MFDGECPLSIYAALKIHGTTRDKTLIDTFYNLGICISYDRLPAISTDISNSVLELYESGGVVCPPKLRNGLFITAATDNIDHNPSSTTSLDSFHGTAISLIQHPSSDNLGNERPTPTFDSTKRNDSKQIAELPKLFKDVLPVTINTNKFSVPEVNQLSQLCQSTMMNKTGLPTQWKFYRRTSWKKRILYPG